MAMRTEAIALMLSCALAAAATGCAERQKSDTPRVSSPIPVKVVTAESASNVSTMNYVGRVEPSKSAVVSNLHAGVLEEIYAAKGRRLRAGDPVAKVNSESVKSAYDIAKATLKQAEDGYARAQQVYGTGSVTEVKMVEIRTRLEQARAAEKSARQALEDCIVRAPFSGTVGEVYALRGENLAIGAPLVQLIDVESIEIHFNVPEAEYSSISVGDAATVEVPALAKSVTGTVAVKGVTASQLSHAYDITLKNISSPASMMPGMVCKVRMSAGDGQSIVIPAAAVMTDMEGRYVWGVRPDNTVCKTYIGVGGYASKGIIVSEGLQEGDMVIVEGSRKVSTGMKVQPVEE